MKQNRWLRSYEVFVHFSIYSLLVLVGVVSVLTCALVVTLAFRLADTAGAPSVRKTVIDEPPPYPRRLIILPGPMPTATGTPTAIPRPPLTPLPAQLPASTPLAVVNPAPGAIPVIYPTSGAVPVTNSTFGAIPVIYPTPGSPPPPTPTLVPPPATSPTATLTPLPDYDYMLAEFFNSPTTNSFLLIYVAIVDPREIPIGDLRVVASRQDNDLTYESPLSSWHYEGYSAPGEVIKTGNLKFEPPGGIETASWVLHLADAQGNRQSFDVPFDVDAGHKQWYFIKFRRKY